MKTLSPEKQLAGFIDKFTPEMATLIRAARKKMRELVPRAVEMVYDNYNFFVIGDPDGLLRGSGNVVRNIRIDTPAAFDHSAVRALIEVALERAKVPIGLEARHQLIIKSVSAKQRPRRLEPAKKK
jgi:hypothetical protein